MDGTDARSGARTEAGDGASMAANIDRDTVEQFLFHEADLLDRREHEAWLALYTDDCRYWVPLEEDQANPKQTVSLIYDDRKLLETRIRRLGHPRIHAQAPPSRTVHMVGNVVIASAGDDGKIEVRSNQIVAEYRQNQTRLFSSRVTHHLVPDGDSFQIAYKRIDLISSEGDNRGIPLIL